MFKELFISNYIQNKTTFIPYGYLRNELYPMYNVTVDGDLEEDESIDENYITVSYDYVNKDADKYDIYRNTEECLLNEELGEQIDILLEKLSDREQTVIRMRFGLVDDRTDYTIEEIARELRVTRERVRQIESSAIKKLKHPTVGRTLKQYAYNDDEMIININRFNFIADYWIKLVNEYNDIARYKNSYSMDKYIIIDDVVINKIRNDIIEEISKLLTNKRALIIEINVVDNIVSKIFRNNYVFIDTLMPKGLIMFITDNKVDVDVEIDIGHKSYKLHKYMGVLEI